MSDTASKKPVFTPPKWWWWCVPAYHRKWKLEKRREEALSRIREQRSIVEAMTQRPRAVEDTIDTTLFEKVLQILSEIETKALEAVSTNSLDDLVSDAELQGQLRAYLCPNSEIQCEAALVIDLLEEWGVPKTAIEKLKSRSEILKQASTKPQDARGVLRTLFEERDSWEDYANDYEDTMTCVTRWLLSIAVGLVILTIISLHFAGSFTPLLVFGLLAAGAAGSCVSVLSKMPIVEVALSAELESYQRRVLSRIAVGIGASVIGCALLASGFFPISFQNQSFAEYLASNTSSATKTLILLGVPMLLGFSERALTSFEQRMFGAPKAVSRRRLN